MQPTHASRAPELPPCDLVLKGGITSALTHAGLLNGLSKAYRLKRLGGSSAGAVGAALGAVAQLALDRGAIDPFERVAKLPTELGQRLPSGVTRLMGLLQPAVATRRSFALVAAMVDRPRGGSWPMRTAVAALRVYWVAALLGGAVGACIAGGAMATMVAQGVSLAQGVNAVLGVAVGGVLAMLFVAVRGVFDAVRGLALNDFGLCRGAPERGDTSRDALTVWLHDTLGDLLGRTPGQAPITFGEIWGCDADAPTYQRRIDLQLVTTALNLRRPFRIPGDSGDDALSAFFYDPQQWQGYFPAEVLSWLKDHAQASSFAHRVVGAGGAELLRLPRAADLPIVVAVRLSLGCPGLLSALPMYTIDAAAAPPLQVSKVFFSDGGITGGVQIDLFDAALPAHPTFGAEMGPMRADESTVERPGRVGAVEGMHFTPFEPSTPWRALFSFVGAVIESARTWRDAVQNAEPASHDRVVRIGLTAEQGGLNLGTSGARIDELGALGQQAAGLLVADFGIQPDGLPSAWDVHRWLRMRSTLGLTGLYLDDLSARLDEGTPSYRVLPYAPMNCYKFAAGGAVTAAAFMNSIGELTARAPTAPELTHRVPRPQPTLRTTSL